MNKYKLKAGCYHSGSSQTHMPPISMTEPSIVTSSFLPTPNGKRTLFFIFSSLRNLFYKLTLDMSGEYFSIVSRNSLVLNSIIAGHYSLKFNSNTHTHSHPRHAHIIVNQCCEKAHLEKQSGHTPLLISAAGSDSKRQACPHEVQLQARLFPKQDCPGGKQDVSARDSREMLPPSLLCTSPLTVKYLGNHAPPCGRDSPFGAHPPHMTLCNVGCQLRLGP